MRRYKAFICRSACVCTLLYVIGVYIGDNRGLYGAALSFALCLLFLPFNIAVLLSLHYNLHYHNLQNKENVVFFAIFSQKSCLKVLRLQKKQYLCIAFER